MLFYLFPNPLAKNKFKISIMNRANYISVKKKHFLGMLITLIDIIYAGGEKGKWW